MKERNTIQRIVDKDSSKKEASLPSTSYREQQVAIFMREVDIDSQIYKFNQSIVETVLERYTSDSIACYKRIAKDWFEHSTKMFSSLLRIESMQKTYDVEVDRNVEYGSVSNSTKRVFVVIGQEYIARIIKQILLYSNISEFTSNYTPTITYCDAENKEIKLKDPQAPKLILANASYMLLHETTHIAQNLMENYSDIMLNDTLSYRAREFIMMEEAMANFVGVSLNKISRQSIISRVRDYEPINAISNIDQHGLRKARFIGYLIGLMAGDYAINYMQNKEIFSLIHFYLNMLSKSEPSIILDDLVSYANRNKKLLINLNEWGSMINHIEMLRKKNLAFNLHISS